MKVLTERERRFVEAYIIQPEAMPAAIEAGYSRRTAKCNSYAILRRPHIAAAIAEARAKREKRTQITADNVLKELARLAFVNTTDLVSIKGGRVRISDTSRMTEDQKAAILELADTPNGMRIKLHDKKGALELLGKHLGLFPTRVELTGRNGGPVDVVEHLSDDELQREIGRLKAEIAEADGAEALGK